MWRKRIKKTACKLLGNGSKTQNNSTPTLGEMLKGFKLHPLAEQIIRGHRDLPISSSLTTFGMHYLERDTGHTDVPVGLLKVEEELIPILTSVICVGVGQMELGIALDPNLRYHMLFPFPSQQGMPATHFLVISPAEKLIVVQRANRHMVFEEGEIFIHAKQST